jgi:hypothetical protein
MGDSFLSDKAVTAIMSLVGAAAGGFSAQYLSPWFKWKLDIKKDAIDRAHREEERAKQAAQSEIERRRNLIKEWREMIKRVEFVARTNKITSEEIYQQTPEYLQLEPFLTAEAKMAVYARRDAIVPGLSLQGGALILKEEIARLEFEWGLL